MGFWDFANNNSIELVVIVLIVMSSLEGIVKAVCNKNNPKETEHETKEEEKL